MCGILGAFKLNDSYFHDYPVLRQSVQTVKHRGPDYMAEFSDNDCYLGHTRLAILGIEASSNQPYHFDNLVMVYNGEVFNYIELRAELEGLGYQFETNSDTEVIIKAFHNWQGECFSKLNGMWALLIYDRQKKVLTVSRDRFGQKPLFLMKKDNVVYYASEIQQLTAISTQAVNYSLIQKFLKEGSYDGVQETFFKSIEIFPKAHYCNISKAQCISYRYWDYWTGKVEKVTEDSFKEFSTILENAIKIRLRSDAPYGILFSGGTDSTIIAAYTRKLCESTEILRAFHYSSLDSDDESIYAEAIAKKLDFSMSILTQDDLPELYINRLKALVKHLGRGHSSLAIVSMDYLCEFASKEGIRVLLDGQGADELLGGYKIYYPLLIIKSFFTLNLKGAFYLIQDQVKTGFFFYSFLWFFRSIFPSWAKKIGRRLYGYEALFKNYKTDSHKKFINTIHTKEKNRNVLNRFLIKQHDISLENLFYYGDIVSMKNSIENRSPFMDHRLVDYVYSRGDKLKIYLDMNKYALKKLPEYARFKEELTRRKIGFSSNIKSATKKVMVDELKTSPILTWPIFSNKIIDFLRDKRSQKSKYEPLLFRLYQVHLWNQMFVGNPPEK